MSIIPINRLRNTNPSGLDGEKTGEKPMVVVIGGVLTNKWVRPLYGGVLAVDSTAKLSAGERFIPPFGFGIGTVEDTRQKTSEALLRTYDAGGGRPLLLVGHSLGALIATDYACEYPETVAGAVCLAGAQQGVKHETLAMRKLIRFINNPAATDMVRHDSTFMVEHHERIETMWPENAPLHVVAPAVDVLLPPPHGYGLQPNGLPTTNRLVIPTLVANTPQVRRRYARSPDNTEKIETIFLAGHVNTPLIPDVIDYVRGVQTALAGQPSPIDGTLPEAV
jgi:hypothetical protein